ncbi:MAG TPA: tRNA (adenosine(37)-N6)-dimethylallyltransferase MiaA, partial [Bacteroidetes bacterium]|nr:tRNA (adenosine(37)-N6)-dimethylallyltransferase MiaA [Bacteroidota bacterium]
AVPTAEQLTAVPHYFIQSHEVSSPLSAADYEKEALEKLEEQFLLHDTVIVCGGSGLYLQALATGLDPLPPADPEYREKLETILETEGVDTLAQRLKLIDPEKAAGMDLKNPRRVIRALEILHAGPIQVDKSTQKVRNFKVISLSLNLDREELYKRIDKRVEQMMETGLLDEVKNLLAWRESSALQTVGYRELFDHLDGIYTLEEAVEKIKQHTRNYAKRQLTWFRNKGEYNEVRNFEEALASIQAFMAKQEI